MVSGKSITTRNNSDSSLLKAELKEIIMNLSPCENCKQEEEYDDWMIVFV